MNQDGQERSQSFDAKVQLSRSRETNSVSVSSSSCCPKMSSTSTLVAEMPKVELHAHLNGSIGVDTAKKLVSLHVEKFPDDPAPTIPPTDIRGFKYAFRHFDAVQKLTDSPQAVALAVRGVAEEFSMDGVRYLELRSTPREVEGKMTEEEYVRALVDEAKKVNAGTTDIEMRILLSVDRRHDMEKAQRTVDMACRYHREGMVVGLDLSGNAAAGDARLMTPLFVSARKRTGLKLAVHLAEIPNHAETSSLLADMSPDRIGHGTCIHPRNSGTDRLWSLLLASEIPVEVCLTSNVQCGSVRDYASHHAKYLMEKFHPMAVCTDDKAAFGCTLSGEYLRLKECCPHLSDRDLFEVSRRAIEHSFADEQTKERLRARWGRFAQTEGWPPLSRLRGNLPKK